MLQQVILVEKTKFIYRMFQEIFSSKQIHCYVATDEEDFTYQIEELRPQIVLVNLESMDFEWVRGNLERSSFQGFKKVGLCRKDSGENEIEKFFDLVELLPIDPFEFIKKLEEL